MEFNAPEYESTGYEWWSVARKWDAILPAKIVAGSLSHPSPIFLLNLLTHMTQIVSPEQRGCREE